ncbi:type II toxin-antitoxin system RelE/ParE family toxin [Hyphomicrobium sp.]|uniref:type II toxin-antitoxin system RelE/ParE family toxin n=1 Tax=Hyphomicrobium sp. TaxID=82 RepID=UPI003F706C44
MKGFYTAEHWSPAQADIYHSKIVDVIAALANGKLKGRSAEHVRTGYLKYAAGSHFVFFKEVAYGIDFTRILHQQMDVEQHL